MNIEDTSQRKQASEISLVKVTWVDAETIGDTGWSDLEEMRLAAVQEPPIMHTVGFILYDSPTHVAVTDSIGLKDCGHMTKIPKAMIKSMTHLLGGE